MNLDQIKKLVKLANNNPNEHEANSAARMVCKLIEEAEFKFSEDSKLPFNPAQAQQDFMRHAQEEMMKQREAYQRQQQTASQQNAYSGFYGYGQNYQGAANIRCPYCGLSGYIFNVGDHTVCTNCSTIIR
jgi:hypothetical protein